MSKKEQKPEPRLFKLKGGISDDRDKLAAEHALAPSLQAAATIQLFPGVFREDEIDLTLLTESLREQIDATHENDLGRMEAMLTTQAHTLDAIFNHLARRAAANMGEYLDTAEMYMKLALRTQSQCRSTIEALSAVKNPPVAKYVKQANIAGGHQQVNNSSEEPPRVRETENMKNELLEKKESEWMDTGKTGEAIPINPKVATMEQVYGT